jgi:hypothetical protein
MVWNYIYVNYYNELRPIGQCIEWIKGEVWNIWQTYMQSRREYEYEMLTLEYNKQEKNGNNGVMIYDNLGENTVYNTNI